MNTLINTLYAINIFPAEYIYVPINFNSFGVNTFINEQCSRFLSKIPLEGNTGAVCIKKLISVDAIDTRK